MKHRRTPVLQGEAAAATLPGWGAKNDGIEAKPVILEKEYRYMDRDVERIVKFPVNRDDDVSGNVASASSPAMNEYQDKLKAINLREKGLSKPEIAEKLGRTERWVKRWWRETPALIERPGGQAGNPMLQKASMASFRDVDIRRGFLSENEENSLCEAMLHKISWRPAKIVRRDLESGGLVLAYDQQGNSITERKGREVADYKGGIGGLDHLLQRIFGVLEIRDPQARIFLNHYKDGSCGVGNHRHDHWSVVVSLGAERILVVDGKPVLTRNGDLLNFGTQSHGVPVMPDITASRISLVIFYYPDADNMERRQWSTIKEGEEESPEHLEEENRTSCNPSAEMLRTSVDASWHVSILWGEIGASGQGAVKLEGAKTSDAALAHALEPISVHRKQLSSPHSQVNVNESEAASPSERVTVFALGIDGAKTEKELFAPLLEAGVGQLWDIRSPETLKGNLARHPEGSCADPAMLKRACTARCITYRSAPLGRRAAGGIERHIVSDEGRDVVARLVNAVRGGPPLALLGGKADWQTDDRRTICDAFATAAAGSISIMHLLSGGGQEPHPRVSPTTPTALPVSEQEQPSTASVSAPISAASATSPAAALEANSSSLAVPAERTGYTVGEALTAPAAPRRRRWGGGGTLPGDGLSQ